MSRRLVQLVADYGPGDLAFAELAQQLELVAPEAELQLTRVPARDTLAAGWCVARLALCAGPSGRLIVVDVPGAGPARFCAARADDDVVVVAANRGWVWSFVVAATGAPYCLEVPAGDDGSRDPCLLAEAVVRIVRRQPHGVLGPLAAGAIPAVPESVVAFVDCDGSLDTTVPHAPAGVGERMRVQIGEVAATALVTDGRAPLGDGALALRPGTHPFSTLTVGGGSAAELFGGPRGGEPVALSRA